MFGIQLGGGTDINQAVAYCQERIEDASKAHLILISNLYECGDAKAFQQRYAHLMGTGINVIVLLDMAETGAPLYDTAMAENIATMGALVFACAPHEFPDLMACSLKKNNIADWTANNDIK